MTFSFGTANEKKDTSAAVPAPGSTFGFAAKQPAEEPKPVSSFSIGKTAEPSSTAAADSSSLFSFGKVPEAKAATIGAPATTAASTFQFGTSSIQSPLTQGAGDPPKSTQLFQFGTSGQAQPAKNFSFGSSAAPTPVNPSSSSGDVFKFGGAAPSAPSAAPSFSFGSALKSDANTFNAGSAAKSASFPTFGSQAPAPTPAAPTQSGVFSFGSSSSTTAQPSAAGVFQFGTAPTAGTAAPFGVQSSSTSAPAAFGTASTTFGSATSGAGFGSSAPAPGGFNFGGAAGLSSSSTFTFGASSPAPNAGFPFGGGAPSPTFGSPAQPSMFSIGSGSTAPKGRTIARARRTKR